MGKTVAFVHSERIGCEPKVNEKSDARRAENVAFHCVQEMGDSGICSSAAAKAMMAGRAGVRAAQTQELVVGVVGGYGLGLCGGLRKADPLPSTSLRMDDNKKSKSNGNSNNKGNSDSNS